MAIGDLVEGFPHYKRKDLGPLTFVPSYSSKSSELTVHIKDSNGCIHSSREKVENMEEASEINNNLLRKLGDRGYEVELKTGVME